MNGSVGKGVSAFASESQSQKCSMILPVYISHRCTKKRVLVYALLDTMSDTSFVTEDAMSIIFLGLEGIPVNLSLSTLSNKNELVQTSKVSGLHVTGYKSDKGLNLGPVFSGLSIPVNRGHITTFDKIKHWSHLQFLRSKLSPELDCPVELIIGYDNSDALVPLFTTPSVNFGPYAQCTKLGWVLLDVWVMHMIVTVIIVIAHYLTKCLNPMATLSVITQHSASRHVLSKNCHHGTCLCY